MLAVVSSGITQRMRRPPLDSTTASDAELAFSIALAPAGDARAAEAELCKRFAPRLLSFGRKHLADRDAAHDLVQRTLELTIEKLRRGEVAEPERIAGFVLGVARLQAHELRRRGRREETTADIEPVLEVVIPREPEPLAADRLTDCLQGLGERERSVVLLSFYAEQDSVEVAQALGMSAGNVRVVRHRAIERLRGCMGISEDTS